MFHVGMLDKDRKSPLPIFNKILIKDKIWNLKREKMYKHLTKILTNLQIIKIIDMQDLCTK